MTYTIERRPRIARFGWFVVDESGWPQGYYFTKFGARRRVRYLKRLDAQGVK